jgi:hypothetical protein
MTSSEERKQIVTQHLRVIGETATLSVEVLVGTAKYRVNVTVERMQGGTINEADATIALTEAMHEFPQRTRRGS